MKPLSYHESIRVLLEGTCADKIRHKRDPGRCYRKAGWKHVGFTAGGLWAYQQLPHEMPAPDYSLTAPLFAEA